MRIISKRGLWLCAAEFPDARTALQIWMAAAAQAQWHSLGEVRRSFPATDMVGKLGIFHIEGNHYRLIVRIEFGARRIYIKEFLTHAEYDKGGWEKWL